MPPQALRYSSTRTQHRGAGGKRNGSASPSNGAARFTGSADSMVSCGRVRPPSTWRNSGRLPTASRQKWLPPSSTWHHSHWKKRTPLGRSTRGSTRSGKTRRGTNTQQRGAGSHRTLAATLSRGVQDHIARHTGRHAQQRGVGPHRTAHRPPRSAEGCRITSHGTPAATLSRGA